MVIPPSCHHKQTNRSFAGKAIEMSIDHKPEDEPETERVLKAGGKVTGDGRINGGLNLSRAIGDHAYKQNKELSDREQMITALPDVKTLTINPGEDEFMVLACDGIWNSMSSQEVVDFIKPRMTQGVEKLSKICEQVTYTLCFALHILLMLICRFSTIACPPNRGSTVSVATT
jgi:serine/threonine protein phosphatase PrpC